MDFDPRAHSRTALVTLGLLAATATGGCTSHPKGGSPSPSTLVSANPTSELASVAQRARSASYTATYVADSSENPPRTNTIKVYRTPTRTRLDVTEATGHVLIQVDPTGTYTCNVPAAGRTTCLRLAGAGQPVPANVDPSGQNLFTTTLDVLAQGADLTVTSAPPSPQASGLPSVTCYAVIAAAAGGAPPGTYCFTAEGVIARAQFRSNVLRLTALGPAPVDADFTLPAAPVPLASSSPSPSPSG
ncbi:MAG: hypothetical protein QOJ62_2412 [Actinomycetota bacterium]|nr:hypothetical protein [Actinomycetota bacterium]